jgi:putative spermidine/putrescine transport system permease protein
LVVFQRSLFGAVIVTFVTLLLAFPYAYLMVRTPSNVVRRVLLFSLFLPFFIGQVVRAYGWLIILGQEGMVNFFLGWFGLEPVRFLFNFSAVVVGLVQYMLPFAVLVMAPAIVAIDEDVERASVGLGATWRRTFWHIVLPLARPGLIAAVVVVFTISLTDFAMPAIMGGGRADFMANIIYSAFFNMADSGLGSALSVFLVLIGSTVFALFLLVVGTNATRRAVI